MSFRTKLLLVVLLTIFASVSVVAYAVTHYTQAAFEAMDTEHTEALVAQFKKEYDQRGEEIAHQAKNIAEGNFTEVTQSFLWPTRAGNCADEMSTPS